MMNIEEAKTILNACVKEELQDHAFGDREVYWMRDGKEIGVGYFGSNAKSVSVLNGETYTNFAGDDATALDDCGTYGKIERNDETGPAEYSGA